MSKAKFYAVEFLSPAYGDNRTVETKKRVSPSTWRRVYRRTVRANAQKWAGPTYRDYYPY